MRSTVALFAGLVLFLGGCPRGTGSGPIVVLRASYPRADAQAVADAVAAPIEQQVNGVEWMERLESETRSDGSYTAYVLFRPHADPKIVTSLVRNRVALAQSVLPQVVQRAGVAVLCSVAEDNETRVSIALVDRGGHGWDALRRFAELAVKRLSADGVIANPEVFPDPEGKGVYRVDMYPAIRITGSPAQGKTAKSAASRCRELIGAEQKAQNQFADFAVENVTAR